LENSLFGNKQTAKPAQVFLFIHQVAASFSEPIAYITILIPDSSPVG